MTFKITTFHHDGKSDFPHGAGPSWEGWYAYPTEARDSEPNGPFDTEAEVVASMADHPLNPDRKRWDPEQERIDFRREATHVPGVPWRARED